MLSNLTFLLFIFGVPLEIHQHAFFLFIKIQTIKLSFEDDQLLKTFADILRKLIQKNSTNFRQIHFDFKHSQFQPFHANLYF